MPSGCCRPEIRRVQGGVDIKDPCGDGQDATREYGVEVLAWVTEDRHDAIRALQEMSVEYLGAGEGLTRYL